ncbi:YkyB family protein [Heyndrickxia coagulans]|uniref:YkyB family protein n=1 Tax=Heyndrickxia coagulans TaxID=1398 RepID=UPI0023E423C7|nr:YkyB family protein [Heyndrickxia coagulans]
MENYRKWEDVPENLKTKTQLKALKRKPVGEPKAMKIGYRGKKYPLYDINETQVVKQRQTDISALEMTIHNIAESLYIINKLAKKSRDTKKINYFDRNYGVVNRAKTRQLKLYALKDAVLRKLLDENKAEMIGYHTQNEKKLLLIQLEDYTFHLPAEQGQTKCLKHLGEIAIISAAATGKVTLKYNEAVKLLETFLQKD